MKQRKQRQGRDEEFKTVDQVGTLGPLNGPQLGDTMWKYEQLRAGRVYTRMLFNSRREAEDFASEMTKIAPDLFCRIEPIESKAIWN